MTMHTLGELNRLVGWLQFRRELRFLSINRIEAQRDIGIFKEFARLEKPEGEAVLPNNQFRGGNQRPKPAISIYPIIGVCNVKGRQKDDQKKTSKTALFHWL
jgi:hypothetical protein